MEIHKLKRIHSWRDFLKELGTIVLGICIAISLEQMVESWHWDQEVKVGRQALKEEIAANNTNILALRVAVSPCLDRQIEQVDAILNQLEAGARPAALAELRNPPGSLIRDSAWQSEQASQVLTHFPRDEMAMIGRYYGHLPDFRNWLSAEGTAWLELSILRRPPSGMTTSDLIRLRTSLAAARSLQGLIVTNARRELRLSEQLGVHASADPVRVKNYCTMSTEDYRRYRATQDLR